MSERQMILAGLKDLEADRQMQLDDEHEFIDSITQYDQRQFLAYEIDEEARRDRQAILSGFDPLRDQIFTRQEHILAVEELVPPMTHDERMDFQLHLAVMNDCSVMHRRYEEDFAWNLIKGLPVGPQSFD